MIDLSERQAIVGIFLAGLATLMFELLVNKALAFSTWGTLGYMIIGSAVFGYSIAGVVLALWQPLRRHRLSSLVTGAALLFSTSVLLSYLVMNVVPFDFEGFLTSPLTQALYLTCWYLVLLVPFSATGFIVAILLYAFKERSNRLYAADLVGAGLGCILVVPSFPLLGAAGTYFLCAGLGALGAIAFARGRLPKLAAAAAAFLALCLIAAPYAQRVYPVKAHQHKRQRGEHFDQGFLTHSMWSFLSKIEVAQPPAEPSGMLWFDGGLMQSAIDHFSGDLSAARTDTRTSGENSLAYRLKPRQNVLIIAPAGGRELRAALAWGAGRVTGVELDSSVVQLVHGPLNEYLGGIYRDPRVVLVNDEGRSFVRRSKEEYDTIQFISAYSVPAVQSGAVDLASSYLMTVEAFEDYLDHLSDDGVLSVARDLNIRLFATAWTALERRGLDPRPRLVLLKNRSSLGRNTLLVKLSPFGPDELALIKEVCLELEIPVNYAPSALMSSVDVPGGLVSEPKTRRLLEQFVQTPPPNRQQFFADLPYRSWPVYDNKPFFNALRYIGNDLRSASWGVTEEITELTNSTWYVPYIPIGDAPRAGRRRRLCPGLPVAAVVEGQGGRDRNAVAAAHHAVLLCPRPGVYLDRNRPAQDVHSLPGESSSFHLGSAVRHVGFGRPGESRLGTDAGLVDPQPGRPGYRPGVGPGRRFVGLPDPVSSRPRPPLPGPCGPGDDTDRTRGLCLGHAVSPGTALPVDILPRVDPMGMGDQRVRHCDWRRLRVHGGATHRVHGDVRHLGDVLSHRVCLSGRRLPPLVRFHSGRLLNRRWIRHPVRDLYLSPIQLILTNPAGWTTHKETSDVRSELRQSSPLRGRLPRRALRPRRAHVDRRDGQSLQVMGRRDALL